MGGHNKGWLKHGPFNKIETVLSQLDSTIISFNCDLSTITNEFTNVIF